MRKTTAHRRCNRVVLAATMTLLAGGALSAGAADQPATASTPGVQTVAARDSTGTAAPATRPPVTYDGSTRSAASFTDSVGVNAHWTYWDTPYGYAYEDVRARLVASGIKHVRGDATRAADLARSGIDSTVLVDLDTEGRGDPAQQVRDLAPLAASGAVVAVEGPNEGDLFWTRSGFSYQGLPFPAGVVAWQNDLAAAVDADPSTRGLTVIGPSLGRTYWGGGNPFAPGSLAPSTDWGNFHPYPSGNPYADRYPYAGLSQYYNDADFPSVALDKFPINLTTYSPPFAPRPMASTETGYSTWKYGQSEVTQGRYMPRLFLENYRLGIQRTFSYELVDAFDDPAGTNDQAHYGLLRRDLTPKPAYNAVKSLLGALADPGADPSAPPPVGRLAYTVSVSPPAGYDKSSLHHIAFEKSDGSVVIALWNEVSANDLSGLSKSPRQPIRTVQQPAYTVKLDLGARAAGVNIRTIDDAGVLKQAASRRSGNVLTLTVPDRVTLVTVPAAR